MAVVDRWPSARGDTGAQNPAYRPARPPPQLGARRGMSLWPRGASTLDHRHAVGATYLPGARMTGEKMPPRGGIADKVGNRYEGRIALWRIGPRLHEPHDSVRARFEEPGDDRFEWWVQRTDGSRTYTQVKRQQSVDEEWTIGTLVSRGVLPAFGLRLGEEPAARCEFFSALSASHLQQMAEDARMAKDLAEFEAQFVAAKEKKKSWQTLVTAWPDANAEQAWRRLQRVTAGNVDEQTLRETLRAHAQALVDAPPDDVIARLGEYLDNHLCVELTAGDVWDFLQGPAGFRPTDWRLDQNIHTRIHDETGRYRDGIAADRAPLAEIRRSAAGLSLNCSPRRMARPWSRWPRTQVSAKLPFSARSWTILRSAWRQLPAVTGRRLCWRPGWIGSAASATRTNSGQLCAYPVHRLQSCRG
jgi:hypothetical protein